ncbi:hypothetical protein [Streptosporangium amethystogenes]|uniref:hypothetical protein n=1 Tax=Streptosporangium amethystogenes TaxID=2002 RepID=UPI0004C8BEFD|nr:hypothetical protein [Streptosporangium amethystogenes]
MGKDLVRGAGVGLLVGLGLGYPVSRLYEKDIETYTVMPMVAMGILLIVPGGWLLAEGRSPLNVDTLETG